MASLKLRNAVEAEHSQEAEQASSAVVKAKTKVTRIKPSSAAWWIKNPPKTWAQQQEQQRPSYQLQHEQDLQHQQQRKQSFSDDMGELFRNISMPGYGRLFDPRLTLWEKLIWLLLHLTCMTGLILILSFTWEQFVAQYFVINLHDPLYPNELVPFPAVSICSNNRLSRQALNEYAIELSEKDPEKRSAEYFVKQLRNFIHLYSRFYSEEVPEEVVDFQTFLEEHDTLDNETFYDVKKNMKRLTPKCEKLISLCLLAGVEVDCFTNRTFQESYSSYGLCCTFNTMGSYNQRTRRNSFILPELGLTVVLNTSKADDIRPILNTDGYIVVVHDSFDFPDSVASGAKEVFPEAGEESYVSIRARIIDTDGVLRSFHPVNRRCYFTDEAPNKQDLLGNTYSFNNCIQRCRVRSMMALCSCLPFYMPLELVDTSEGIVYCNLQHVTCLNRYSFKWRNILTQRQDIPELKRELEESLYCPLCLAPCDDVQFRVSLSSLPLDRFRTSTSFKRIERKGLEIDEISVLRVHFADSSSPYYRRVIGNAWFEVFSTLGNMISIFVGFSIIVVFEVLYYFLRGFIRNIRKFCASADQQGKRKRHHKRRHEIQEAELYICP